MDKFLRKQPFADRLNIQGLEDSAFTGNFEVFLFADGQSKQMIHSKKTAGQGRAESSMERKMICEFIEEYLDDMEE